MYGQWFYLEGYVVKVWGALGFRFMLVLGLVLLLGLEFGFADLCTTT